MTKKILVAIDDSENAIRAVEFVANTFTTDNRITLFNVVQDTATMCEMNSPELTPYFTSQQSSFCLLEEKKKELVTQALQQSKFGKGQTDQRASERRRIHGLVF